MVNSKIVFSALTPNKSFWNVKKNSRLFYAHPNADIKPDVAFHGSPFNFNIFDKSKIGNGEGLNKYGKGLYLFRTKKLAPFYSNIRSVDAPIHFGCTSKLANPDPTIYTVGGLKNMKLKQVSPREARDIAKNQNDFEHSYPWFDGLEKESGEIIIFPKSIDKLRIDGKQDLLGFVRDNKSYPFREWTTDKEKMASIFT